jgi:arylsulfatase A-like enzyme
MADVISHKARTFIKESKEEPFFLFFSLHDIHVPRVPHSRFAGKSEMGPRGDAIVQLDWCLGQVLEELEARGVAKETLVVFSSDNGPVLDDGYHDEANEKLGSHWPSGKFRGGKYSLFEGGTRVPTIARWPGRISAGTSSNALFGQVDLAASLAKLVGVEVPVDGAPDSRDELDTLLGKDLLGRPHLVHEAGALALRSGNWKFIAPGAVRENLGPWKTVKFVEPGALYKLSNDPGEQTNLAAEHPDQLKKMADLLTKLRTSPDRL